jgi:hypothetical protein
VSGAGVELKRKNVRRIVSALIGDADDFTGERDVEADVFDTDDLLRRR